MRPAAAWSTSTFLGGSGSGHGAGIAVDASGNVYVTGQTYSPDFPTTPGAYDTSFNGDYLKYPDTFITSSMRPVLLVYSTFLGGSAGEYVWAIAVDASVNAYVTGFTRSSDFPTTPGA